MPDHGDAVDTFRPRARRHHELGPAAAMMSNTAQSRSFEGSSACIGRMQPERCRVDEQAASSIYLQADLKLGKLAAELAAGLRPARVSLRMRGA